MGRNGDAARPTQCIDAPFMNITRTQLDCDNGLPGAATRAGPHTPPNDDIEACRRRLAQQTAAHCRGPHTGIH
jgi:hypothetical protein